MFFFALHSVSQDCPEVGRAVYLSGPQAEQNHFLSFLISILSWDCTYFYFSAVSLLLCRRYEKGLTKRELAWSVCSCVTAIWLWVPVFCRKQHVKNAARGYIKWQRSAWSCPGEGSKKIIIGLHFLFTFWRMPNILSLNIPSYGCQWLYWGASWLSKI